MLSRSLSAQGSSSSTLSELWAAHGHSVPGPIAFWSAPSEAGDARAFVAEAGVLAVIQASTLSSWQSPLKLAPISSRGVRAIELRLDPEADPLEDPTGSENLLYVAGGRMGLWAMRADPRAGFAMPAARIDDAHDANDLDTQSSRRWVNDLDFVTIGESTYLVALFAAKDDSRLRMYELSRVRAVLNANPGQETGNEIWPDLEVVLDGNPAWNGGSERSFAFGLAVDGADVYVALGMQGLVRVTLCAPPCTPSVTGGPWFGDGSSYAGSVTGPFEGVYDDFHFVARDPTTTTGPLEVDYHQYPPYFLDVALQRSGESTYLWCAVDHLGILRFDVSNAAAWGASLAIDHQEGGRMGPPTTGVSDHMIRLASTTDVPGTMRAFAHRLSILQIGEEVSALGVALFERPYFQCDGQLDEGRIVNYLIGEDAGAIPPFGLELPVIHGDKPYTLLYDLDTLVPNPPASTTASATYQYEVHLPDVGGRRVLLATAAGSATDRILLLGGSRGFTEDHLKQTTFVSIHDWPSGTPIGSRLERTGLDRPGRHGGDVGHSRANPDVIYTARNDAGLASDGILTLCSNGFHRDHYQGPGGDARASFGILFDPDSAWRQSPTSAYDFVLGAGVDPGGEVQWMIARMYGGANLCPAGTFTPPTSPPDRVKTLFVSTPAGRFGENGRGWYVGGSRNAEYDQFLKTLTPTDPHPDIVLVTRDKSPWGLVALRSDMLEAAMLDSTIADGEVINPKSHATYSCFLTDFDTHPEFANLDPSSTTTDPTFFNEHNLGPILTHFARFLKVESPSGEPPDHWVVAVGAGTIYFPPEIFPSDPAEEPDQVYQDHYEHSMLRVFLVNDPGPIFDEDETTFSQARTLIGPSRYSHAYRIENFAWEGRSYLVVADLGGAVQLWDLTDLLDPSTPTIIHPGLGSSVYGEFMLQEWRVPESLSDDLPNTVWSLAVDYTDTTGDSEPDEVHVYALVGRVGIEVLRFEPSGSPSYLIPIDHIETPSGSGGLSIRIKPSTGEKHLLLSERDCGLRAFRKP